MLIKEKKELLFKQLDIVEKGLPGKTTMSILNNILLECHESQITFISSNLEIGIKSTFYTQGSTGELSILIPSKIIDIVKSLPDDQEVEIEIDPDSSNITIKGGSSLFNLQGINTGEYPSFLENIPEGDPLILKESVLKDIIRKTVFGVSHDESRPAFTGVLFSIDEEKKLLTVTSSDTYRLMFKSESIFPWGYGSGNYLVPAKALRELMKILEEDEDVKIFPAGNHLVFLFKNIFFFSRLLEERFPDVTGVIPETMNIKLMVDRKELEGALNRASLVVEGNLPGVKISVKENFMEVSSGSEIGKMQEQVKIVNKEGTNLDIYLNIKFLSDVFKIIDTKNIIIEFIASEAPCIIRPEGDEKYLYLVLPIKMH